MLVCVHLKTSSNPLFDVSQMGYGSRALKALNAYYSGEVVSVDEETRVEPEYPFPGKVGKVCLMLLGGGFIFPNGRR